jgi:hypothetical protein
MGAEFECGSRSFVTFGSYYGKDASASSNRRETMAVLRALLYFRPLLLSEGIRSLAIWTDNMVTVYNLNRQGASVSLLNETRQIFSFLTQMDIHISVTHVPGVENGLADSLSRMDAVGDYELKIEVFNRALAELNVRPTVDLFADCNNRKCARFLALPGPRQTGAQALDAMRYQWKGEVPYAFPPIQLIPRVPQKLRTEAVRAVVVVPEWCGKAWWNLLQMNVERQIDLGPAESVLRGGPTMAANRAKLPPGRMLMALVSYG